MECGKPCKAKGVGEVGAEATMLTFELEAAEALAGLACSSSLPGEFELRSRQQIDTEAVYQALVGQQFSRETSTMAAGPASTLKIVETTPSRACNTSNQSKVSGTLRHSLTEAEKEAQRLRRVLANRASARQTIRRRQAMYLDLTGKAANLLKENSYLKQEKELAVKKYNYLKDKNEFLKAQMAKRKHAEAGHIHDRPESSRTEISSSAAATTPICLHNRPSLAPFFWPFNSKCASNTDFTNASQCCLPMWDESCLSQGQECSSAVTKPRPLFFILPVPWSLPSLSPDGKIELHSATKDHQHEPPSIHQCPMCLSLSTPVHEDTGAGVCNSARVIPTSNGRGAGFHLPPDPNNSARVIPTSNGRGAGFHLPPDPNKQSFLDKNHGGRFISSQRKPENNDIAATEARRRRRELMKLKNIP